MPPHLRRVPTLAVLALLACASCGGGATSGGGPTSASRSATATPSAPSPSAVITSSSVTTAVPVSAAPPAATPAPCAVGAQSPTPGTIGASFATALAFAPDGRLFWAERGGTVKVWQDGAARTFATVNTVTSEANGSYSERGLLGLAVSPSFARDHFVFGFYSDADYQHQHVIRWTDCAGSAQAATIIATFPSGSDCCHKGGRLAAGTDGTLLVTLGDEHVAPAAQSTGDVRGKVLRYNLDGSIPTDNPFGPGNPVWAYGLRNPFGIAVSAAGQVAVTSNGPSGDAGSPSTGYDVAVLNVTRGGGYQWPDCYGYSHPLAASSCPTGQSGPDWSSERSTVVPTGATFVDASGPSGTAGHLVFCTYASGMLILTPGSPHATVSAGPGQCRLDVKQGPDHALYFSDESGIHRMG